MDSHGKTLEFYLSATCDAQAARSFFLKGPGVSHTVTPGVIAVDKNATYPKAFKELRVEHLLPEGCEVRQSTDLNNLIEHDHRFIPRPVKQRRGFFLVEIIWQTLQGF